MNYALIENGIITNIIWLYPGNASDFPNTVPIDGYSVGIGDTYDGEHFYHNGEKILNTSEKLENLQSVINILVGEE